jgi:hypothetical protein
MLKAKCKSAKKTQARGKKMGSFTGGNGELKGRKMGGKTTEYAEYTENTGGPPEREGILQEETEGNEA